MGNEAKKCKAHGEFYRHKADYAGCHYPNTDECDRCEQEHVERPHLSKKKKSKKDLHTPVNNRTAISVYTWLPSDFETIRPVPWDAKGKGAIAKLLNSQGSHVTADETPPGDLGAPIGILCDIDLDNYRKDQNPIHLLGAFVDAFRSGLYPPTGVLEVLASAFERYLAVGGKISLDEAMGLQRPYFGIGRYPKGALQNLCEKDQEHGAHLQIFALMTMFGVSIDEACEMICARLDLKRKPASLKDSYHRSGGHQTFGESIRQIFLQRSEDDQRTFLLCYPTGTIPPRLRKKYRIK